MNKPAFQIFGEFMTGLSYAGRCPSWLEYEHGSPMEKRAISTRWSQIVNMPNDGDKQFKEQAVKNYSRYCLELNAAPSPSSYPVMSKDDVAGDDVLEGSYTKADLGDQDWSRDEGEAQ